MQMSASAAKVVPFQKTAPAQDEKGRFALGNSGGGRRKGSRNKIGEDFLSALCNDFEEHGIATIEKVREQDPAAYIQICAKLIPKEYGLTDEDKPVGELSDDALMTQIARTVAELASSDLLDAVERAQLLEALKGNPPPPPPRTDEEWEAQFVGAVK
jgi:hypothetical protein